MGHPCAELVNAQRLGLVGSRLFRGWPQHDLKLHRRSAARTCGRKRTELFMRPIIVSNWGNICRHAARARHHPQSATFSLNFRLLYWESLARYHGLALRPSFHLLIVRHSETSIS